MEQYPYASSFTDETVVRSVSNDIDTNRRTTWLYSTSSNPSTEFMYYDDEGNARSRTFLLPQNHDLGLDAVPALVEEGLGLDGGLNGAMYALWTGIVRKEAKLSAYDGLVEEIWNGGRFFALGGKAVDREGITHRAAFFRDIGSALPTMEDSEKSYQYTRTALLVENWSNYNDDRIVYYPLTVLANLVGKQRVDFLTPTRYEYQCLIALKSFALVEDMGEEGIYLNRVPFIKRTGVYQWLSLANELLAETVTTTKGAPRVAVVEVEGLNQYLTTLGEGKYESVYVISRSFYKSTSVGSLPVEEMRERGYEYRGMFAYRVAEMKGVVYPIFYFSSKTIGATFPVSLKSRSNNDAPAFPREAPFDFSERSTGLAHLYPKSTRDGSVSWYGAAWSSESRRGTSLPIMREEGDKATYFITLLLPDELPLKKVTRKGRIEKEPITLHRTYHNPTTYTTIPIYRGSVGEGVTHKLPGDWYLTKSGDSWYLHSETAKTIDRDVWSSLSKLQGPLISLPQIKTTRASRLSYSSIVRHWSSLRYQEALSYSPSLVGSTRQYVTSDGKMTNESIGTVNEFGVYSPYSLPVQTTASPAPSYPLPTLQKGVKLLHRESEGRKITYSFESKKETIVQVEVRDGLVLVHDPYSGVERSVKKEDGIYNATIRENKQGLRWHILSLSDSLVPWDQVELVDYLLSYYSFITEDDLRSPPSNHIITIHSPVHLEGDTMSVRTLAPTTVGLESNTPSGFQSLLGRSDPLLVVVGERESDLVATTVGDVAVYTPSELSPEYTYSPVSPDLSLFLAFDDLEWSERVVPSRRLVITDERKEEYSASYYEDVEGEEIEQSTNLDTLVLYRRKSIEDGAEYGELHLASRGSLDFIALRDVSLSLVV